MKIFRLIFLLIAMAFPASAANVRLWFVNPFTGQNDTNYFTAYQVSSNILSSGGVQGAGVPQLRIYPGTNGIATNYFGLGFYAIADPAIGASTVINVYDSGQSYYDYTNILHSGFNTYVVDVFGGTNTPPTFNQLTNALFGWPILSVVPTNVIGFSAFGVYYINTNYDGYGAATTVQANVTTVSNQVIVVGTNVVNSSNVLATASGLIVANLNYVSNQVTACSNAFVVAVAAERVYAVGVSNNVITEHTYAVAVSNNVVATSNALASAQATFGTYLTSVSNQVQTVVGNVTAVSNLTTSAIANITIVSNQVVSSSNAWVSAVAAANTYTTAISNNIIAERAYAVGVSNNVVACSNAWVAAVAVEHAYAVGVSNELVSVSNLVSYVQSEIGCNTNYLLVTGGTSSFANANGTNVWGVGSWTNLNGLSYVTNTATGSFIYISGTANLGASGFWPVGNAWTNIVGSGTIPTSSFLVKTNIAGANMTITRNYSQDTFASSGGSGGGISSVAPTNVVSPSISGSTLFVPTNYDLYGAAVAVQTYATAVSNQLYSASNTLATGTALVQTYASGASNTLAAAITALGTADTNYANQKVTANGGQWTNGLAFNSLNLGSNSTWTVFTNVVSLKGNSPTNSGDYVYVPSLGSFTNRTSLIGANGTWLTNIAGTFYLSYSGGQLSSAPSLITTNWTSIAGAAPTNSLSGFSEDANGLVLNGWIDSTNLTALLASQNVIFASFTNTQNATNLLLGSEASGAFNEAITAYNQANAALAAIVSTNTAILSTVATNLLGATNQLGTNLLQQIANTNTTTLSTVAANLLGATNAVTTNGAALLLTATNAVATNATTQIAVVSAALISTNNTTLLSITNAEAALGTAYFSSSNADIYASGFVSSSAVVNGLYIPVAQGVYLGTNGLWEGTNSGGSWAFATSNSFGSAQTYNTRASGPQGSSWASGTLGTSSPSGITYFTNCPLSANEALNISNQIVAIGATLAGTQTFSGVNSLTNKNNSFRGTNGFPLYETAFIDKSGNDAFGIIGCSTMPFASVDVADQALLSAGFTNGLLQFGYAPSNNPFLTTNILYNNARGMGHNNTWLLSYNTTGGQPTCFQAGVVGNSYYSGLSVNYGYAGNTNEWSAICISNNAVGNAIIDDFYSGDGWTNTAIDVYFGFSTNYGLYALNSRFVGCWDTVANNGGILWAKKTDFISTGNCPTNVSGGLGNNINNIAIGSSVFLYGCFLSSYGTTYSDNIRQATAASVLGQNLVIQDCIFTNLPANGGASTNIIWIQSNASTNSNVVCLNNNVGLSYGGLRITHPDLSNLSITLSSPWYFTTNLVVGTAFANNYGDSLEVQNVSGVLTEAAVSGYAALQWAVTGASLNYTNTINQDTSIGVVTGANTNAVPTIEVGAGGTLKFTDVSSGAGNTATLATPAIIKLN